MCWVHAIVPGEVHMRDLLARHAKNFEWAEKTGTMASNRHVPEQNGFHHLHHVHVDLNNG
jgi:hypothetical protein